jgi:hypothetical protein
VARPASEEALEMGEGHDDRDRQKHMTPEERKLHEERRRREDGQAEIDTISRDMRMIRELQEELKREGG